MWRLLALLLTFPALAAETPRARVTLVTEVAAIASGVPFRLALRQQLAPGWHTYWRNPGDAGQPPEVTLALPEGATAAPMQFPAPSRIPYGPLVNFGYEGEAIFTIAVTPPAALRPGDTFAIEATATWLVCQEVCIPEEGRFTLTLPVEAAARTAPDAAPVFARADAAAPRAGPFAMRIGFEGTRGAVELTGPGLSRATVREAFFFPEAPGVIDNAAPQPLELRDGALSIGLRRGGEPIPPTIEGVIAITDAGGQRSAFAVAAAPGALPIQAATTLWPAIGLALLGGLVLNLMPCVFPVLAMKALGLARMSGATRGTVRAHGVSTAAGVILSFIALGGGLVALRAAGGVAGWGFQFTSPVFVAGMAWLIFAVGLNLAGVFAVGGPVAAGGRLAATPGHAGAFFTGVLAVLVATPCTAPFMAAAIGAALAMPTGPALAVFAAMGAGMALPYLLLAVAPGLARRLPRPGAWMERLRQALAFPMFATAAWLVWVLSEQLGSTGVFWALAGAVLIGFGAWALGVAQAGGWRFGRAVASAMAIGALALLPVLAAAPAAVADPMGEAWSETRLAALRAESRPVFVNITAAWCITCKVNERVALGTEGVRRAFAERGIVELTGDWTRGDAAISGFLRAQGHDGVPLYLFYPAGGGAPRVLPQILTEGSLLRAIE
ncbi:protein-disulfide reductase DsbD family protein [Plastoroseomonas arctica]|uniref:Cytochrome C biogenesis protein n=1 Tax=Plastoroseomonas arctica TaxID=1509237 RepID=A0AAF1JZA9_9PROT|nr:protein-disulfide reductase DsbD domain-containing protein [Plastoroseomonas arctica]MBR0654441.1 cytochrome C biogenesis protein [Plastoroseomonas arctica]